MFNLLKSSTEEKIVYSEVKFPCKVVQKKYTLYIPKMIV